MILVRIENEKNPFVKNKLLDLTHLPAQPYSRQYNENDLLTEIERPNPNWHEGDPEDERYIIEYVDEGYTGFLPVNLQIENPNFVQLWGKEDNEGEISFDSLPITENGKYKFLFNDQSAFANGFIPVKRYDNETEDYDYNINISNKFDITTFKITRENGNVNNGVISDFIKVNNGNISVRVNQYSSICKIEDYGTYYSILWLPAGGGATNVSIRNNSIYQIFVGSMGQMFWNINFEDLFSVGDGVLNNLEGQNFNISKDIINIPFLN